MNALWANRKARVGLILVGTMTALASFGWFAYDAADASNTVGPILGAPDGQFWFGTTMEGKDVWVQTLYGAAPTIFLSVCIGLGSPC